MTLVIIPREQRVNLDYTTFTRVVQAMHNILNLPDLISVSPDTADALTRATAPVLDGNIVTIDSVLALAPCEELRAVLALGYEHSRRLSGNGVRDSHSISVSSDKIRSARELLRETIYEITNPTSFTEVTDRLLSAIAALNKANRLAKDVRGRNLSDALTSWRSFCQTAVNLSVYNSFSLFGDRDWTPEFPRWHRTAMSHASGVRPLAEIGTDPDQVRKWNEEATAVFEHAENIRYHWSVSELAVTHA